MKIRLSSRITLAPILGAALFIASVAYAAGPPNTSPKTPTQDTAVNVTARADPSTPGEPAQATLCFDLNVGEAVPCTPLHTDKAQYDIPNFMKPHSGPREVPEKQDVPKK